MIPLLNDDDREDPIEYLSPDVSVQWIAGGRILLFHSTLMNEKSFAPVDKRLRNLFQQWPLDRSFCLLTDLRDARFEINLSLGTQIRRLIIENQHFHVFSATLINTQKRQNGFITLIMSIRIYPSWTRKLFTDNDTAIRWLRGNFRTDWEHRVDGQKSAEV